MYVVGRGISSQTRNKATFGCSRNVISLSAFAHFTEHFRVNPLRALSTQLALCRKVLSQWAQGVMDNVIITAKWRRFVSGFDVKIMTIVLLIIITAHMCPLGRPGRLSVERSLRKVSNNSFSGHFIAVPQQSLDQT